jgi:phage terminase small subunit
MVDPARLAGEGVMARPRKPTEQHVLAGTYRRDRHGPLEDAADGSFAPPEKPAGLGSKASDFWDVVVKLLEGVVRERDGPQLHQLCFWWAKWEDAEIAIQDFEIGTMDYTRALNVASVASQNFDRIAKRFGLTPADRAALRAEHATTQKPKVATRPKTQLDKQGAPKVKPKGRK